MKVHRFIKYIFLLAICMFSSFLVSTVYGKDINESSLRKTDFAFVINFVEGPQSDKIYLLGKYPSRISITLLHKYLEKTCSAQTTSNIIKVDSSGADLTEIQGNCVKPDIYKLAIINKNVENYKLINPRKIANPEKIASFDKTATQSKALLHLRHNNKDGDVMNLQNLNGSTPQVSYFNTPSGEVYIISYHDNVFDANGPRIASFKGVMYPLTGWCSYDNFYIFLLNDEYYINSGSSCCGCGVTAIEIFKVTSDGIIKFDSNSDLSD